MTQKTSSNEPIPIAVQDPLQPHGLFVSVFNQPRPSKPQPEIWIGETLLFLGPSIAMLGLLIWFILR